MKRLAARGFVVEVAADQVVTRESLVEKELFVILEGVAEVRAHDARVAILHKGDIFGEIAFFMEAGRRTATVRTCAPCKLLVLRRRFLEELMRDDPAMAVERLAGAGRAGAERSRTSSKWRCHLRAGKTRFMFTTLSGLIYRDSVSYGLIHFTAPETPHVSRIGGLPYLEAREQWPLHPTTRVPLLYLGTIVGDFFRTDPELQLEEHLGLSMFLSFEGNSRPCARSLAVHQQDQLDKIGNGAASCFVHRLGRVPIVAPAGAPPPLPERRMSVEFHPEEEAVDPDMPDCGILPSKIGGIPAWAQDVVEPPDHRFAMQLDESQLVEFSPDHHGIFGEGTAFLFAKPPLREGDSAMLFIQFT